MKINSGAFLKIQTFIIALFLTLLFINKSVNAQTSLPDYINALQIQSGIKVDGNLSEPAWQRAVRISNFTQRELEEGQPASEKTEVAIIFDMSNLYIGVWCYDKSPEQVIARKMERDFDWGGDDNFEIIIDTYHNRRDGYLFVTNPNGARADAMVLNNGQHFSMSWDGVWDVKTSVTNEGWFAEFVIPFSTLKFSKEKNQEWGINFERNIRRKHEQVMWQGWSRDSELEQVSRAGTLIGLKDIENVRMVEIKPYSLAGWQNENGSEVKTNFDFGGDLNYLITPTLKLNLTVNTDFAQVESDKTEINLSRFSIKYPEKREFFLEGDEILTFGERRSRHRLPDFSLFYSRRIGLADGHEAR
ncbi:MAG: carbohydrate binding family 9 domain-containing protein, partial [Calditrichia bacterium]|nr:carbohydrate binding family 9 domain-containing protein [Calditrichia bacterium]